MSEKGIRWMLAAIVVVVLGGAIVGIGQGKLGGGGSSGGAAAPAAGGAAREAAAKKRLGALGVVAAEGRKAYGDGGCAGCHTLADDGSHGTIGPDLDTQLTSRDLASIKQSIVDPAAAGQPGFSRSLMPRNFGSSLSPKQLDALARYIAAASLGR